MVSGASVASATSTICLILDRIDVMGGIMIKMLFVRLFGCLIGGIICVLSG